jgi:KRAB domain-containing zinc finger protein
MFVCATCGSQSGSQSQLNKHSKIHDDTKFSCSTCGKQIIGHKALKNHELIHQMTHCIHCQKLVSKKHKNEHQLTCSGRRDSMIFKCELCPYESGFESNLKRHKEVHSKKKEDETKHKCGMCKKEFKLKHQLKQHMKIHLKIQINEATDSFICTYCSKSFSRKDNMNRHIKSEHIDKRIESTVGFGIFKNDTQQDLTRTDIFQCQKCDYKSNRSYNLTQHMKRSHLDKNETLKCDLCQYSTSHRGHLNRHMIETNHENKDLSKSTKYRQLKKLKEDLNICGEKKN